MDKEAQLYCRNMEVIKLRVGLIDGIVNKKISCGLMEFDWELIALNLRKILELIAYSSLIANKDKYSQAYEDFMHHDKVKDILKRIEGINPEYYPKPYIHTLKDGQNHFKPVKTGYLKKEEFIALYKVCSTMMHQWNPYKPFPKDKGLSPISWLEKIAKLLDVHFIKLVNSEEFWIIQMNSPKAKVLASKAGPVNPT